MSKKEKILTIFITLGIATGIFDFFLLVSWVILHFSPSATPFTVPF